MFNENSQRDFEDPGIEGNLWSSYEGFAIGIRMRAE
jgi:hypothetical protein